MARDEKGYIKYTAGIFNLMIIHRLFIKLLRYLFGPLSLVLLLQLIPAYSASITMEHSLGFNGIFQLDKWTPFNVMLENRGRTISGILEVVVTSGSEYRGDVNYATYSMDVELPVNSKKLFSFTILINSFTHPLIVRLRQAEEILVSTSLNLRLHYTMKRLMLFVGNKITPDFLSMLPEGVVPIFSRAQFLPETWYGYDGVEMLILHASALKDLRERQFIALTEWVKKGGYLITSGLFNYGVFSEERTRRLLPVKILGFRRISELHSLEEFCGQRLASPNPFLILKAEIGESLTLLKEYDIPVIIEKKMWLGKVIFLAFDYQTPPFTDWAGRGSFWKKILALKPPAASSSFDLEERKILSSMISAIPIRFPRFLFALCFFAGYIIPLKIMFNRVEENRGQRWKNLSYLMAIIIAFSAASWWLFFFKKAQGDLSYNSFLHLKISGQDKMASSKYIVGFYSLRDGDYELRFAPTFHPITPILPYKAEEEVPHSLALHENDAEQIVLFSLDRWSHRFFGINSMMNFPIRGEVFVNEQGLVVVIENRTPHTIIDCQLYFTNRLFSFGNIGPRNRRVKRLARSDIGQKELFQSEAAKRVAESIVSNSSTSLLQKMQRNLMKDLLLSVHSRYDSRQDALHLFGWIESELISINLKRPDVTGEGVALLEWEIPVSFSEKDIETEQMPDRLSTSEALSGRRVLPLKDLV
ncbi:MAG: hypothetical protein GTO13_01805 [Proteobacteria bacterium]|nr:hypothetical protein [Pseudomonadota bacterium]